MSENGRGAAETPYVTRQDDGGVVTLTLNRGERFNPLSMAMIAASSATSTTLAADCTRPAPSSWPVPGAVSAPATTSRRCARTATTSPGSSVSSPTAAG